MTINATPEGYPDGLLHRQATRPGSGAVRNNAGLRTNHAPGYASPRLRVAPTEPPSGQAQSTRQRRRALPLEEVARPRRSPDERVEAGTKQASARVLFQMVRRPGHVD